MPRLIPAALGNGRRPSDPAFSRLTTDTAIPILDVSDDTHEIVGSEHDKAVDAGDLAPLLGAVVLVDNASPVDGSRPGPLTIHVGASTLHEAATECVTCVGALAADMPEWIASTDENLAAVLAEHFTVKGYSACRVISMKEASS